MRDLSVTAALWQNPPMTNRVSGFWRVTAGVALLLTVAPSGPLPLLAHQQDARTDLALPTAFLQGYVKTISGDVLVYPWAYPGQVDTLLSRATDGAMAVEWEGEAATAGAADEPVTYLWHAGMASGYGAHAFALTVNGQACATFRTGRTTNDREWDLRGTNACELSFKTTRVGTFSELFGFMWLKAPRSLFGAGPPRFRIVGEAAGNQDYYLGQKSDVRSWVRVQPEEAVLAGGQRALRLEASTIGPDAALTLATGSRTLWSGTVQTGFTSQLVPAGPNADVSLPVQVTLSGRTALTETLPLTSVRSREVHLLPHSHVDIGYSDPQPDVERKQWKNLRDAVELARKTAAYPPEARFKWNVEGLWSVDSYLKQASADERQAFVEAVNSGSVGLQANYTNVLTGLMSPEELRHWTDAARQLRAAYGFGPIRSAMHSDIPGLSWTVVGALAQAGVRYFSSGPNYMPGLPDSGDRIGGALKALGDKPFWWTSPSGEERLLFWMAGHGYSWFHGLNTGKMSDNSRDAILDYVRELVSRGYAWDLIQARYTIGGDNGPTDPNLPDVVKHWNEQFETPRLVISTTEALFAEMEKRHGAALPVMSGDMTPYWEDGAISTAAEEALTRAAARRLAQAQALFALKRPASYPAADLSEAWRNVLLWHEHTWGAADSITQPDRPDVVAQWEYKRAFAVQADQRSRALLDRMTAGTGESIDVVNTLTWKRAGLVLIPQAQSRAGDRVRTHDGRLRPSQRLLDGSLAAWLDEVPALGSLRLTIEPGPATPPTRPISAARTSLDNGRIRADIDPATGAISTLTWRRQIAATPAPRGTADTGDINVGRDLFGYVYVPGRDPAGAQKVKSATLWLDDKGPLVATIRVGSDAPGATALTRTLQLVAGSDALFMTADLDKRKVRTKESAHLAFPLTIDGGVIRLDEGEALIEPEKSQLPGSCRDFVGIHSVLDVSGADVGVSIASLDAPLFELGTITDERQNPARVRSWPGHVAPGTSVFAYLLNNYWHTNYKADQEGLLRFRFALRPHAAFDAVALRRFSEEQDQPLLLVAASASDPPLRAPFTVAGTGVVASLVEATEGGAALTIRLYNPGTIEASAIVTPVQSGARLFVVDTAAGSQTPTGGTVRLPPYATRTLRLESQK